MKSTHILILFFAVSVGWQSSFANPEAFNIRDFGAMGSKVDDATPAITRAIDACRKVGGGTVFVPAGEYRCQSITLYDNITFDIEAGATLFVDLQNPNFKGEGFICAYNAKNITVKGNGVIDGQAKYVWADYKNDDVEISNEVEIARKAGIELKRSYRVGNTAFTFLLKGCKNIRIEGVTVRNSSSWCMKIWGSDRVTVEGVTINSDQKMGVNSDGIDIDSTRNVHIYGCNITTGDDAICIKSGTSEYLATNHVYQPLGNSYPSGNIVVDNCILSSSSTALMIGTETYSDIRHVIFSNCVIRDSNKGFGINVQDGATISDIMYANITMDLRRRHWNWWGSAEAFYFVLKQRLPDSKIGIIKNITIDNVIAHAQGTSKIITTVNRPLENISIHNFQLFMEPESTPDKRASDAITADGVNGMDLQSVRVYWDDKAPETRWKSALALTNVNDYELVDVSARQGILGSQTPAIELNNTSNGLVRDSEALAGTGLFLKIEGVGTKHLQLSDNIANDAKSFASLDKSIDPNEVRNKD